MDHLPLQHGMYLMQEYSEVLLAVPEGHNDSSAVSHQTVLRPPGSTWIQLWMSQLLLSNVGDGEGDIEPTLCNRCQQAAHSDNMLTISLTLNPVAGTLYHNQMKMQFYEVLDFKCVFMIVSTVYDEKVFY